MIPDWCRELGKWVFVCEQCGWAHLCGDACTERVMDASSDFMPVCPISGRAFPRMMTWVEVRGTNFAFLSSNWGFRIILVEDQVLSEYLVPTPNVVHECSGGNGHARQAG